LENWCLRGFSLATWISPGTASRRRL
jgi:hypothetical protein